MICTQEMFVRISIATIHTDSLSFVSESPSKYQDNSTFNQDKKHTFRMISI
jgi:hypothetical protein